MAIDNALPNFSPALDLLGRRRVDIPNVGFANRGPADIGAFEFNGTPGAVLSGSAIASATPTGGLVKLASAPAPQGSDPAVVTVAFTGNFDRSSVQPTDLVLSGDGIDGLDPVRATSLNWVDSQTVEFVLSGTFRSSGTVKLDLPAGSILAPDQVPLPELATLVPVAGGDGAAAPVSPTNSSGTGWKGLFSLRRKKSRA